MIKVSSRVILIFLDSNSLSMEPKSLNHYSVTACTFEHSIHCWRMVRDMDYRPELTQKSQKFVSALSRLALARGSWLWRAYQQDWIFCYCVNWLWRAVTGSGEFSRISNTRSCFCNPLSALVSYP
jgi:hypothetical protein